jgi:hypothetical protein
MTVPTSVRLKIGRALEHLLSLDTDIGVYLEPEPWKIVRNTPPSDPRLVLIEIHVTAEPDDRLGVVVGDCLYNLRSALDHLACRLVEVHGGTVTSRTQFPIVDKRRKDKAGKYVPLTIDGGISAAALATIESLQPYQRGGTAEQHPLSILRELSNADKHRLLHLTVANFADTSCYLCFPNGRRWGGSFRAVSAHEVPIAAFEFPEPISADLMEGVEVEVAADAFVALRAPGPWIGKPVTLVLNDLVEFVHNVVVPALDRHIT